MLKEVEREGDDIVVPQLDYRGGEYIQTTPPPTIYALPKAGCQLVAPKGIVTL